MEEISGSTTSVESEMREARVELRLPATGLSVITNSWAEESVSFHGHEDVVSQAGRASEQLQELIEELLRLID